MRTNQLPEAIRTYTTRCKVTTRGGGIEIDLKPFGFNEGDRMSAYQNYLGGGILGRICDNHNIRRNLTEAKERKLERIATALKQYFHDLTNHEEDEWESETFEANQNKPVSAY